MSGSGRRAAVRQMPASGGRSMIGAGTYHKDSIDYEEKDISMGQDGSKHVEKVHYKHKEVDGSAAVATQGGSGSTDQSHHTKGADGSSWGCMWVVWIVLIFIIILIIVMAVLWACKPNCITRECDTDESGCEVDLARAALYAFVITFFLVLIGCAIWWGCGSRRY